MNEIKYLTTEQLNRNLENILSSPRDEGIIELIIRRPENNQREILEQAELDPEYGLVGDNWNTRGSPMTSDGSAHPEMQLNIMNSRVIALLAQDKDRWPLAGDQFYIDMDLSRENLPPGIRLAIGTAMIEVTEIPHLGCKKFAARFGENALKFVNSGPGKQLNLRGINARVIQPGIVKTGDMVRKLF